MQRRKKRKRDKASGGDAEQTGTAVQEADAAGDAIMASDLLAPLQVSHQWLTAAQYFGKCSLALDMQGSSFPSRPLMSS